MTAVYAVHTMLYIVSVTATEATIYLGKKMIFPLDESGEGQYRKETATTERHTDNYQMLITRKDQFPLEIGR